ncbi:MAG TPA: hypothetical protein PKB12_10960 [Elusimicrobiota bacterium]|nr:hypothetical protein [Elusimicrobiota bacterium]
MRSMNVVVVHYAELGLKGGNRRMFERKLMDDIRANIRRLPPFRPSSA